MLNLTKLLKARKDSYAQAMGAFILRQDAEEIGDHQEAWLFMRRHCHLQTRVLWRCDNGIVRDVDIRQGVYNSQQDGLVAGDGHPMADFLLLNLATWTCVFGGKAVNTGTGSGYRTMGARGILVIRVNQKDFVTAEGAALIRGAR